MLGIVKFFHKTARIVNKNITRTIISPAYYCNEVWEQRLNDTLLQKVNLDEFYHALDQRFQKTQYMSAVDVDVFVNAAKEDIFVGELLDVVHKLRLSADTSNTLTSTHHAVVRYLVQFNFTEKLLEVLDDRINYGIFLDHYTANLLLDIFWKKGEFVSGARVASQLMLQEDVDQQLFRDFALLHCYKFLLNPHGWPKYPKPEEPEEEVKIRIKYLRNPYFDDHFDLRDPLKIVGKTIVALTKGRDNVLDKSFYVVGLALYDKVEQAKETVKDLLQSGNKFCTELIKLLPNDHDIISELQKLEAEEIDVEGTLMQRVKQAERSVTEKDISVQCKLFDEWINERKQALEKQNETLQTQRRLAEVDQSLQDLKEKETKLWFFENEEKIELEIEEAQKVELEKETTTKKKKQKSTVEEDYIPPEVQSKYKQ